MKQLVVVSCVVLSFSSCIGIGKLIGTVQPYHEEMDQKIRRSLTADIEHVDFYLSDKLALKRRVEDEMLETNAEHEIEYNQGFREEEILFTKRQPARCIAVVGDTLFISFSKDKESALPFVPRERDGLYGLATQRKGGMKQLTFRGNDYRSQPEDEDLHLLVEYRKNNTSSKKTVRISSQHE